MRSRANSSTRDSAAIAVDAVCRRAIVAPRGADFAWTARQDCSFGCLCRDAGTHAASYRGQPGWGMSGRGQPGVQSDCTTGRERAGRTRDGLICVDVRAAGGARTMADAGSALAEQPSAMGMGHGRRTEPPPTPGRAPLVHTTARAIASPLSSPLLAPSGRIGKAATIATRAGLTHTSRVCAERLHWVCAGRPPVRRCPHARR